MVNPGASTAANRIVNRLRDSPEVWSWAYNGFRLASGVFLLPLLLRCLTDADLGIYYVFLGLATLAFVVDGAIAFNVGRHVSYAMAGAEKLTAQGVETLPPNLSPNYALLHELLRATRALYGWVALAVALLLLMVGSLVVGMRAHETTSPTHTWLAWGATIGCTALELYSGWRLTFLRGLGQVLASARIAVATYATKLICACILLVSGAGLLSLPLAGLVAVSVQLFLGRKYCLRALPPTSFQPTGSIQSLLAILWPNSWRTGLQLLSGYLAVNVSSTLCLHYFGLTMSAQYGLSMQVFSLASSMATVWIGVQWPLVAQARAREDYGRLRELLWSRFWLQNLSFLGFALGALLTGQTLLDWLGSHKHILPASWLVMLALNSFLEMQFSFWTVLIATGNRIPSLWPTVITNLASLLLAVVCVQTTTLGVGALILAPLLAGGVFNYWYWPLVGARSLQTSWLRFLRTQH